MAFFPLGRVLRRFPAAAYVKYASPQTFVRPCPTKKIHIYELDTDDVTIYLWMNAVFVRF